MPSTDSTTQHGPRRRSQGEADPTTTTQSADVIAMLSSIAVKVLWILGGLLLLLLFAWIVEDGFEWRDGDQLWVSDVKIANASGGFRAHKLGYQTSSPTMPFDVCRGWLPLVDTDLKVPDLVRFYTLHEVLEKVIDTTNELAWDTAEIDTAWNDLRSYSDQIYSTGLFNMTSWMEEHGNAAKSTKRSSLCTYSLLVNLDVLLEWVKTNISHFIQERRKVINVRSHEEPRFRQPEEMLIGYLVVLEERVRNFARRVSTCNSQLGSLDADMKVLREGQARNLRLVQEMQKSWSVRLSPTNRQTVTQIVSLLNIHDHVNTQMAHNHISTMLTDLCGMVMHFEHLRLPARRHSGVRIAKQTHDNELQNIYWSMSDAQVTLREAARKHQR